MNTITELIYDIITNPIKGLTASLSLKKPFLFSVIVVLTAFFCHSIAVLLWEQYTIGQAMSTLILRFFIEISLFVIFWILITSLFHFIASWLHAEGNIVHLFILVGITLLPFLFLPAAAIFSRALGEAGYVLYKLFFLGIFIWMFCLQILSLEVNYKIPFGKALLVYLIPFISTFVIPFMLIISTVIFSIFLLVENL